jgi:hypothetical protein
MQAAPNRAKVEMRKEEAKAWKGATRLHAFLARHNSTQQHTKRDQSSMASSAPAPAAASASVSAASSAASAELYPQFDPTSLGLPADFLLYKYNALKG